MCLYVFLVEVPYHQMKFHVIDALLAEFYLSNDDILHYNLAVNISDWNSNRIERISYHHIRFRFSCYGKVLDVVPLKSFGLGTKNTTYLHPVFHGQTLLKLRGSNLRDFNEDKRVGSYSIHVYLNLKTQLKHAGGGKSKKIKYFVDCGLFRLHLLASSSNKQTRIDGLVKTKRCDLYNYL
ncbi:hypothetical protein MKX01_028944 [Papaver californicum]|nr:hypothetical protein MKX01_028944 [Papaver californicum]